MTTGGGKVSSILDQFPDHANLIALIIANWTGIESILVRWMAYLQDFPVGDRLIS
jgi:hypothetical protein